MDKANGVERLHGDEATPDEGEDEDDAAPMMMTPTPKKAASPN